MKVGKQETSKLDLRPVFSRSPVDIIVPFHGEYNRVITLIQSIWKMTQTNPYQVCLVDDASSNEDFIERFKSKYNPLGYYENQILPIRSEEKLGFGGAVQLALSKTKQPWVCILQSDCTIEDPAWLIEMGRSLVKLHGQKVAMVSARTNNPGDGNDERLKCNRTDRSEDIVLGDDDPPLPLYCVMFQRQLIERIGPIKAYPFGMYEDMEFAYRMRHHGYKQAICGKSWVRHDAGATFSFVSHYLPNLEEVVESNRQKCIEDIKSLKSKRG